MVKRSRDQSHEAPSRLSWLTIVPPDSAFHCPDALEELFAAQVAARRLCRSVELALDHHLRGDAGMVGAGLPQHVAPAHALEADQDVLQRVVERVAHVQGAGDVGRRNDEAVGLSRRRRSGRPARNACAASQAAEMRASMSAG